MINYLVRSPLITLNTTNKVRSFSVSYTYGFVMMHIFLLQDGDTCLVKWLSFTASTADRDKLVRMIIELRNGVQHRFAQFENISKEDELRIFDPNIADNVRSVRTLFS